jgi:hypothetical protein
LAGNLASPAGSCPLLVASREYVPDRFGQGIVGEGFDHHVGI